MENLGREILVKITGVEEHPKKIATINVTSKEYGQLRLNYGSEMSSLKFKYPPVGVFQHNSDSLILLRRPQRQWRRGLCADNALLMMSHRWITGKVVSWDLNAVQAAFDHKTYTKDEALNLLAKGKHRSVALDNAFTMMLNPTAELKGHLLLHWAEPVALVDVVSGKVTGYLNLNLKPFVEKLYDNSK